MTNPNRLLLIFILGIALFASACGGGGDDSPSETPEPSSVETEERIPTETAEPTEENSAEDTADAQARDDLPPVFGIVYANNDTEQIVIGVDEGGPAAEAGLLDGDVITAIDGEEVNQTTLPDVIRSKSGGDVITVTVLRGDAEGENQEALNIDVTLGTQTAVANTTPTIVQDFIGAIFELADGLVTIIAIEDGLPADQSGLQVGDVVIAVDGVVIEDNNTAFELIGRRPPGDVLQFEVQRDDETFIVGLEAVNPFDQQQSTGGATAPEPGMADDLDFLVDENVWVVNALLPNAPLDRMGFENGDRIVAFNGEMLDPLQVTQLVPNITTQNLFTVTVERDGETVTIETNAVVIVAIAQAVAMDEDLTAIVQESFANPPVPAPQNAEQTDPIPRIAIETVDLDEAVAASVNVDVTEGLYVLDVRPQSAAFIAGLEIGDVITEMDGRRLPRTQALERRLAAYQPGDVVTFTVVRGGETRSIEVTLEVPLTQPNTNQPAPPGALPGGNTGEGQPPALPFGQGPGGNNTEQGTPNETPQLPFLDTTFEPPDFSVPGDNDGE